MNSSSTGPAVCSGCGEPVRNRPPTGPWPAGNGPRPRWSHLDGELLYPVVGRRGYEPAKPVRGKGGRR